MGLPAIGLAVFGAAVALLTVAPPDRLVVDESTRVLGWPLLTDATVALGALAIAVGVGAYLHRAELLSRPAIIAAGVIAVYTLSVGVVDIFQRQVGARPLEELQKEGQVGLSVLWSVLGGIGFAMGLRTHRPPIRLSGLALLGIATVKVFLVDLTFLDVAYRVLSLVALGALLLISAMVYSRDAAPAPADKSQARLTGSASTTPPEPPAGWLNSRSSRGAAHPTHGYTPERWTSTSSGPSRPPSSGQRVDAVLGSRGVRLGRRPRGTRGRTGTSRAAATRRGAAATSSSRRSTRSRIASGWITQPGLNYVCKRLAVPPGRGVRRRHVLRAPRDDAAAAGRRPRVRRHRLPARRRGGDVRGSRADARARRARPPGTAGSAWLRSPCLGPVRAGAGGALHDRRARRRGRETVAPVDAAGILARLESRAACSGRASRISPSDLMRVAASVPQAGAGGLRLLARVGLVDPARLDDYRAHGGYRALGERDRDGRRRHDPRGHRRAARRSRRRGVPDRAQVGRGRGAGGAAALRRLQRRRVRARARSRTACSWRRIRSRSSRR